MRRCHIIWGFVVECVFCRIVEGGLPASVVASDEKTMAFMDIQPVNPGHVLVIPKNHACLLSELDETTGAQIFRMATRVARALRDSGVKCEGVNLFLADGESAGQEVPHIHLHVIPRFHGDGFRMRFGSHYGQRPARTELNSVAARIAEAMH
jgi:histidine triad (HIT) family protein